MAKATTPTDKSKWIIDVAQTATPSGNKISVAAKTLTIPTSGKYIDRDIEVDIAAAESTIAAGAIKANAPTVTSGSASQAATGFTKSTSATDYYVTLSTTAGTAKSNAGVQTDGYVTTDKTAQSATATSVSVSGNGDKLYIPTNTISASTTDLTAPSVAVSGAATGMETSSSATSYYVTVSGSGTNGSVKGKATAGATTGIVPASTTATQATATTITPGITGSGDKVYIKAATLSNTKGTGTYAENTTVSIPSGGALYINAGYMPNTYITLDQILDGKADTAGSILDSKIASGYVMYDVDGVKHTGSMANVTPTFSGKTVSWEEGFVSSGSLSAADGSIKLGSTVKTGDFTVNSAAADQTITVTEGYLPGTVITVKGSSAGDAATLNASGTASASMSAITLGAVNETAWTIPVTGSATISGTANAGTATSGYATAGTTKATGSVTGTASLSTTLSVYDGTFNIV